MKLMCARAHRSDGLIGDRCRVRIPVAECGERLAREPEIEWCSCGRGIFSEGHCSACGRVEKAHGDDFGCSLCGRWFTTLSEWQEHVYGSDSATFDTRPHGDCDPRKVADKLLVSGRLRTQSGVARRRRLDRERKRKARDDETR